MMTESMVSFRLSEEQRQRFDHAGYLVVEDLFTDAELQPVIAEIEAEVDRRALDLVASGELTRSYAEVDFEHRLARITEETDRLAVAIWNGALAGPAVFDQIRNPKLLDLAEQFCGPEVIASSVYRLRPKVPGHRNG